MPDNGPAATSTERQDLNALLDRVATLEAENARLRTELAQMTAQRNDHRRSLNYCIFGEEQPWSDEKALALIEECERSGVSSEVLFRELDKVLPKLPSQLSSGPVPGAPKARAG